MDLVLWIIPGARGALAARLLPPAFDNLELSSDDGRSAGPRRKGAELRSGLLPFPLAFGRDPAGPAPGEPFEPARLQLRLALAPDPPAGDGELIAADEDDLGALSLLSEYLGALATLVDELALPLRWIAPAGGALVLEVGPLADDAAAPLMERLLLLRAAADLLARARGFRVGAASARLPERPWRDLDGALRPRALEAEDG